MRLAGLLSPDALPSHAFVITTGGKVDPKDQLRRLLPNVFLVTYLVLSRSSP